MFKGMPIIGLTIFMVSFALCGCQEQVNVDNSEPISYLPSIEFEATIVSLSVDDNIACEGICPAYEYPKDTGIIIIHTIINSSDFDWASNGIEKDTEIEVHFDFSARPTKIRRTPDSLNTTSDSPETPTSQALTFTNPVQKENGYFVYVIQSTLVTKETLTVLPGLENGTKFSATGWYGLGGIQGITIGQYQILS